MERSTERWERHRFVVEGPILVEEALRSPLTVHAVHHSAEMAAVPEVPAGVTLHTERPGALERVLDAVTPRPVAAVVSMPEGVDDAVPTAPDSGLLLVAIEVGDPGNVGTLMRSSEAAGATGLVVAGGVDPFHPKVVRSSAGSIFRVDLRRRPVDAVVDQLTEAGWTCLATTTDGEPLDEVDLTGPLAVLLGAETAGLPEAIRIVVPSALTVPMAGGVESLNVAMAGTVIAFEWARRRRNG